MKHRLKEVSAVHCLGNGSVCAYGRGADIIQLFGPDYSAPTALSFTLTGAQEVETTRLPGTCIFRHELFTESSSVGGITDFTAASAPIFVRIFELDLPLRMAVSFGSLKDVFFFRSNILAGTIPEGELIYRYGGKTRGYPTAKKRFCSIALCGDLSFDNTDIVGSNGAVGFFFSEQPSDAISEALAFCKLSVKDLLSDSFRAQSELSAARDTRLLSCGIEPSDVIDDVCQIIFSQQSKSGAVLAGYNYHLCYVRDNYAVHRALMKACCPERASALLGFFIDTYEKYGRIQNAQGSDEYAFHVHENDDVEITGYILLMCYENYAATGDLGLLKRAYPLISHCIHAQHSRLKDGMLSFNGDETYIAGGLLPRSAINDGSFESSVLYATALIRLSSLENLLPFTEKELDIISNDSSEVFDRLSENFEHNGELFCNHPGLYAQSELPFSRNGVRQCGHGFGASYLTRHGDYVCPACFENSDTPVCDGYGKLWNIPSALLLPSFIDSPVADSEAVKKAALLIEKQLETADRIVGYDYGFLICALRLCSPQKENISALKELMLSLRDETGSWVEYYTRRDGKLYPSGTLCRTWESAVSLIALLS